MSAPTDTGALAAPLGGNEKDGPSYRSLCIDWGFGGEQIVLQAEELRELVSKWSVDTLQNEPHEDRRHESENFANAFYGLCWATKFGAPYPLAWVRCMQGRACWKQRAAWLPCSYHLDLTQSPIEKSDCDLPQPDAGSEGAGRGPFIRRKFQDWLLVVDADTGEGVDVDIGRVQRMATSDDHEAPPALRIVVRLPVNAFRFVMDILQGIFGELCRWGEPGRVLKTLRRDITHAKSMTEQDLYELRCLLDGMASVRDGVAAVMGFMDGGSVQQIADEARAGVIVDTDGLPVVVSVLNCLSPAPGPSGDGNEKFSGSELNTNNFQQKTPCNDHPLLRRIEEARRRGEDVGRKTTVFRFSTPADVEELQQLFSCASEQLELLRDEVDDMLARLTQLGFVAYCLDAENTMGRAPSRVLYGAINCGLKSLALELWTSLKRAHAGTRWSPDFDEEMLEEWCALKRKDSTTGEQRGRDNALRTALLDQLEPHMGRPSKKMKRSPSAESG
eukprot:g17377.t1